MDLNAQISREHFLAIVTFQGAGVGDPGQPTTRGIVTQQQTGPHPHSVPVMEAHGKRECVRWQCPETLKVSTEATQQRLLLSRTATQ